MTGNRDEKFEQLVRLVGDGMEQRFRRDRVVVHVDGSKIKIEHPGEPGTFLSREYTSGELARFAPDALAKELLDGYANVAKQD